MKRPCVLALTPTDLLCVLRGSGDGDLWPQGPQSHSDQHPVVIARQRSFMVGGSVITNPGTFDPNNPTPEGQTLHGDHAYVQFQIPPNRRDLPLVMWHGASQSSKT
jgi:hypothetical protein